MEFNEEQQREILDAIKEVKEEEKLNRKAIKLSDLKNKIKECTPCKKGVVIQTALKVCKMADKIMKNKVCDQLHDKVVMEDITTNEYLYRMRGLCGKDSQAKSVIQSLLNGLDE